MGWNQIMAAFSDKLDGIGFSIAEWSVFLVLAKASDENGDCYPSREYIRRKTRIKSIRTVQKALDALKGKGIVSWKSARGNGHGNTYHIDEKVINISTNGQPLPISNGQPLPISKIQTGNHCPLKGQSLPVKRATIAHRRIHKETIKPIVSLSPPSAGSAASPEELLVKQGARHAELPPSAAGNDGVEYGNLVKQYGWKPKGRKALEAVVSHCYSLGADIETAKSFVRYNSIRRWNAVCDSVNVHMLAREWIRIWQYKTPEEFAEERRRRIEAKRAAEEARQAAIIRSEEEAERQKGLK